MVHLSVIIDDLDLLVALLITSFFHSFQLGEHGERNWFIPYWRSLSVNMSITWSLLNCSWITVSTVTKLDRHVCYVWVSESRKQFNSIRLSYVFLFHRYILIMSFFHVLSAK